MNPELTTPEPSPVDVAIARDRRRSFYRDRCVKVLRRYFNVCAEIGRVPSPLGREIEVGRARTSSRRPGTFEDGVIFSIDVERCLEELTEFERGLVVRLVLQEHSEADAARLLNCCRVTISRRLPQVLDKLARIFRQRDLLFRWRRRRSVPTATVSIQACLECRGAQHAQSQPIATEHLRLNGRSSYFDHTAVPVEILCQGLPGIEMNACG